MMYEPFFFLFFFFFFNFNFISKNGIFVGNGYSYNGMIKMNVIKESSG